MAKYYHVLYLNYENIVNVEQKEQYEILQLVYGET